jgi:hypothetical protein
MMDGIIEEYVLLKPAFHPPADATVVRGHRAE